VDASIFLDLIQDLMLLFFYGGRLGRECLHFARYVYKQKSTIARSLLTLDIHENMIIHTSPSTPTHWYNQYHIEGTDNCRLKCVNILSFEVHQNLVFEYSKGTNTVLMNHNLSRDATETPLHY